VGEKNYFKVAQTMMPILTPSALISARVDLQASGLRP
jgi:hypothetical protein